MSSLSDPRYQEIDRLPSYVPDYFEALKELEEGGSPVLKAIAVQFLSETKARMERLALLIAESNFPEVSSLSHTLKGSLATFGLSRAAEVARLLERSADQADSESLQALEPLLARAVSAGSGPLESELERM